MATLQSLRLKNAHIHSLPHVNDQTVVEYCLDALPSWSYRQLITTNRQWHVAAYRLEMVRPLAMSSEAHAAIYCVFFRRWEVFEHQKALAFRAWLVSETLDGMA